MQSADRNVLMASQSRTDRACHSPSTAFSTDMYQRLTGNPRAGQGSADPYSLARQSCVQEGGRGGGCPTWRSRRRRVRETRPSPYSPSWEPRAAQYGTGIHHNVAVPMSDGVELRGDIHYPTEPGTDRPAAGPFPVLMSMTPYGKKAPPPAAQIGGGPTPYLIKRGYIEVMVDVRGCGVSGGSFEMFGARQAQDGVELVDWASKLPNANGRVGMFGVSYLAINQLFTAAAIGPDSPLKAIFPVMSARDFYRDAAAMGGAPHLRTV